MVGSPQTPSTSTDLESKDQVLTSGESTTSNVWENRLSEKKEDEGIVASPVDPTSDVGDYPDGGFAAWCVVLGVSQFTFSFFASADASLVGVVNMCHFLNVGCVRQAQY